jgi:GNAT superfamily N-acetyltransferase
MFWKLASRDFDALLYQGNRKSQKAIVESGETPGLLAYSGSQPVGWIAVEPRSSYPRLARSRVLKPVDDEPVWSITCFFVDRKHRRRGITVSLLRAAISHVKERGGKVLEGYPLDAAGGRLPAGSAYTGLVAAFRKVGFKEVARFSERRPIYRYRIGG